MTRTLGQRPVRAFAAVGVVALVGCGNSDETAAEKAAPAANKAPSAAVPDELVGTWRTRLASSSRSYLPGGTYTIKLLADGNLAMYIPGANLAQECLTQEFCEELLVKVSAGKLTIGDTSDCTDPAVYAYKVAGTKLTTEAVKEDCGSDRPRLFDGTSWKRQS